MVIVEQVIRDLIIATNLCDNRVFIVRGPQVPAEQLQTPYIILFEINPQPLITHGGPLRLMMRDYQFTVYDTLQTRALAIRESLMYAINGYSGMFEGVLFGGIFHVNSTESWENETEIFGAIVDYRILYRLIDPQPVNRSLNRSTNRKGVTA